jgi:hypothetical protein
MLSEKSQHGGRERRQDLCGGEAGEETEREEKKCIVRAWLGELGGV